MNVSWSGKIRCKILLPCGKKMSLIEDSLIYSCLQSAVALQLLNLEILNSQGQQHFTTPAF